MKILAGAWLSVMITASTTVLIEKSPRKDLAILFWGTVILVMAVWSICEVADSQE